MQMNCDREKILGHSTSPGQFSFLLVTWHFILNLMQYKKAHSAKTFSMIKTDQLQIPNIRILFQGYSVYSIQAHKA